MNGPRQTVVSGAPGAIDALVAGLRSEGLFARPLAVDMALHGPQMDDLGRELAELLSGLEPTATAVPFVSTVTGGPLDGARLDGSYWGRNLREPVRFSDAIACLGDGRHDHFLEIGPHPILGGAIAECLESRDAPATVLGSLRRGEPARRAMLHALGALYARGRSVNWPAVAPVGEPVRLPSYPWRRERHWIEPVAEGAALAGSGHVNGESNGRGPAPRLHIAGHPDRPVDLSELLYETRWQEWDRPTTNGHSTGGRWLIVADRGGFASRLGRAIEALGGSCGRLVEDATGFPEREIGDAHRGDIRGLIDLRALDAPSDGRRDRPGRGGVAALRRRPRPRRLGDEAARTEAAADLAGDPRRPAGGRLAGATRPGPAPGASAGRWRWNTRRPGAA